MAFVDRRYNHPLNILPFNMNNAIQNYELLIFDYTPTLRIIGTYHALHNQDRENLENLIRVSDFISLEYDELRKERRGAIPISYSPTKRGYFPQEKTLYVGLSNLIYLSLFCHLNHHLIKKGNILFAEDKQSRNTSQLEFEFAINIAKKYHKQVHLVDMPSHKLFEKLIALDFETKLSHLKSMLNADCLSNYPPEIAKLLCSEREHYMLQQLENIYHCPLPRIDQKGLLIVGMTHALHYYQSLQENNQRNTL
ncbi:hypothetical protein HYX11_04390 [Candidatus Woesearchaeota archaeon]|nr:hypothetical protein [Candidatus Woesearchaeota archaeon]